MKFTGMILTGPKDGEFTSQPAPHLRVPERLDAWAIPTLDPPAPMPIKTHRFEHTELWFADDEGYEQRYGFWVPEGTKRPHEFVIKTLAQAYANKPRSS